MIFGSFQVNSQVSTRKYLQTETQHFQGFAIVDQLARHCGLKKKTCRKYDEFPSLKAFYETCKKYTS